MTERFLGNPLSPEQKRLSIQMREFTLSMLENAEPFKPQYYFAEAALAAIDALEMGNKAVGAVISWQENGLETIIKAYNRVRSGRSHGYHAEQEAAFYLELFLNNNPVDGTFFQRPLPSSMSPRQGAVLYTTLEPCMTCAGRIISTDEIVKVVIGARDPGGGFMLGDNMEKMPPNFQEHAKRRGFKVHQVNFQNPENQHYVDPLYEPLLQNALGPNGVDFRFPKEIRDVIERKFNKSFKRS